MLLTEQWPAPAVATWKAVAQTLTHGLDSLSPSIRWAIGIASLFGVLLGILDSTLPTHRARYLPSAAALGTGVCLACVGVADDGPWRDHDLGRELSLAKCDAALCDHGSGGADRR